MAARKATPEAIRTSGSGRSRERKIPVRRWLRRTDRVCVTPLRSGREDAQAGEFHGDRDERLVRLETDADAGQDAGRGSQEQVPRRPIAVIQSGCEHVWEAEDGGEVVALTEVAGGGDREDRDEGKGEPRELDARERGYAAQKVEGHGGAYRFGDDDEQLADRWRRKVKMFANKDRDGGEPNDQGRIGVKERRTVEHRPAEPALAHEQKPELVVTGGREEVRAGRPCRRPQP